MNITVAIDGPAGAGKSTVAKRLARSLGLVYVDTGSMYRALTLGCVKKGFDPSSEVERTASLAPTFDIKLTPDGKVFLDGQDVSKEIRTPEISRLTSPVSAIPAVRKTLVAMQRKMAESQGVVMDGRDIGTNVLPYASVKIFMIASPEVRAHRRYLEDVAKGIAADEKQILSEINRRDYNDTHRAIDPLKAAADAVVLDTSNLDIDQVVASILRIVEEKVGVKHA